MHTETTFVVTGDIDWASDYCIEYFVERCNSYNIKPTLFVTHESELLDHLIENGSIEVGVHPNFLPNSTHGNTVSDVVDHILSILPEAKSFRSHSFVDSSHIQAEFLSRGISYDSNLCLYLQRNVTMLETAVGMRRYPVFWEDDAHWNRPGKVSWSFADLESAFSTPGIKVLNFHPFNVTANVDSAENYQSLRHLIQVFSKEDVGKARLKGGVDSFLSEVLAFINSSSGQVKTLDELDAAYRGQPDAEADKGRASSHEESIVEQYAAQSSEGKKELLRNSYQQRNSDDIYATSRDYNLRELEIESIGNQLPQGGEVLDLGCGNGYTIISLAKRLAGFRFEGVDFSENMISGARRILDDTKVQSPVDFHCADVFRYLESVPDASFDGVITERLIQNLPSKEEQYNLILEVKRILKNNGMLLACEASEDGFNKLNALRGSVGLEQIPNKYSSNFSTIQIADSEFESFIECNGFDIKYKIGYSTYFLCSRVLHPAVISPQPPKFDSIFNHYAKKIQMNLPFESGIGANTLWVLKKKVAS